MASTRRAWPLALRLAAAIPGGYALTSAWIIAGSVMLVRAGQPRSDAVVLAAMLGCIGFLVFLIWAFAVRSLQRLWAVTVGALGCALIVLYLWGGPPHG